MFFGCFLILMMHVDEALPAAADFLLCRLLAVETTVASIFFFPNTRAPSMDRYSATSPTE